MNSARENWYDVGHGLLGWVYADIPGSDEEACLKAVIEAFVHGEGLYQPSWRRVIHVLYCTGETRIAKGIISYAESVEGKRVC